MNYERIRKIVLDAIQQAVAEGLVKGTSGNIALRDDVDDVVAIVRDADIVSRSRGVGNHRTLSCGQVQFGQSLVGVG